MNGNQKMKFIWMSVVLLVCGSLSSCFTGIEGTKTVTLSKSDRHELAVTEEEKLMQDVTSQPLGEWAIGKVFIVTDPKISYVLEGSMSSPLEIGTELRYLRTDTKMDPGGKENAVIVFDFDGNELGYKIKKNVKEAREGFLSTQLPMLIDLDMVRKAGDILKGNSYWIRTGLWYDEEGNYKKGGKFSKVKILDVMPGNLSFPLKIRFADEKGENAYIWMNFGNSGNESRSFSHLFSMKDIRSGYPSISDEVWSLIQQSSVASGMTKEECKLALGNPTDVNSGHDYSRTLEIWQYPDGTYLQFADGILVNYRK